MSNFKMWPQAVPFKMWPQAVPLTYFPRLLNSSSEQRNKFELSGGGTGIHWEEIDEDISVPGLILGNKDLSYFKKMI